MATIVPQKTLFDVSADWLAFDSLIDEMGGEIDNPKVKEALELWISELQQNEATKLSGYVSYIRQNEMEAEAAKQFAAYFTAKAKARENRNVALKSRMKDYLIFTGRSKALTSNGQTIAVQKNGGKIPVELDEVDADSLPNQFKKVLIVPNNDAIREALESGEVLEFARLLPVGSHLLIR